MRKTLLNDDEAIEYAATHCESIAEMTRMLQVVKNSNTYRRLYTWSERTGIPLPEYSKSPRNPRKRKDDSEIFIENSTYNSGSSLKKRFIQLTGVNDSCQMDGCPNPSPEWNGAPLVIQVDHINGINTDNRIENLRLLCPNCHSQTPTFGSKNRAMNQERKFCSCGVLILKTSTKCRSCLGRERVGTNQKTEWPSCEDLLDRLKTETYTSVADSLSVSGNAVKKHLRVRGYTPPRKKR